MDQKISFTTREKNLLELVFGKKIEKKKINVINFLILSILLFILIVLLPYNNNFSYKLLIYLIVIFLIFIFFYIDKRKYF